MLTYLRHFQARYLNEKGQGIVEYAVIVAIVVAVGVALAGTGADTFTASVQTLYNSLTGKITSDILP